MTIRIAVGALLLAGTVDAQVPSRPDQLASAVLAAPESMRAGAHVYGFAEGGALVTLREGTNDMICVADNPANDGWSVACYHASLEPYMARGRELSAQGMTNPGARNETRWTEMADGRLAKPKPMAVLYVLHGEGFDGATGEVAQPFLRWVFYLPGATGASTGLPEQPTGPGAPWLMFPGTQGAHVMVTPRQGN